MERRFIATELRVDEGDGAIVGYASVFNQWSLDLGGFRERVRPGAFSKTIGEADIRALKNHNPDYILGRNRAGTLFLTEDSHGLAVRILPPDNSYARDLVTSVKRGDITQMSFGFNTIRDEWDFNDPNMVERELVEVRLFDVGPVTFPAYPQTEVYVRSILASDHLSESDRSMLQSLWTATPSQGGHLADDEPDYNPGLDVVRVKRELELHIRK